MSHHLSSPEDIHLEKNGFKAHYVVYGADAMVTTVSVCEDRTAAEEYNRRIMDFIRHNVGPMLASQPVAFAGTVIVHKAG